jgi:hypothetical protein
VAVPCEDAAHQREAQVTQIQGEEPEALRETCSSLPTLVVKKRRIAPHPRLWRRSYVWSVEPEPVCVNHGHPKRQRASGDVATGGSCGHTVAQRITGGFPRTVVRKGRERPEHRAHLPGQGTVEAEYAPAGQVETYQWVAGIADLFPAALLCLACSLRASEASEWAFPLSVGSKQRAVPLLPWFLWEAEGSIPGAAAGLWARGWKNLAIREDVCDLYVTRRRTSSAGSAYRSLQLSGKDLAVRCLYGRRCFLHRVSAGSWKDAGHGSACLADNAQTCGISIWSHNPGVFLPLPKRRSTLVLSGVCSVGPQEESQAVARTDVR